MFCDEKRILLQNNSSDLSTSESHSPAGALYILTKGLFRV